MLSAAAESCLRREGMDPETAEISLSFVSEEEIQQLINHMSGEGCGCNCDDCEGGCESGCGHCGH